MANVKVCSTGLRLVKSEYLSAELNTVFNLPFIATHIRMGEDMAEQFLFRISSCVIEWKDNKYICFQSNTTIFYYLTYWQQVSVIRSLSCHIYMKLEYNGRKIHCCYLITKTAIYAVDKYISFIIRIHEIIKYTIY